MTETIKFHETGSSVGKLSFTDGVFSFEGDADASAKIYLESLNAAWKNSHPQPAIQPTAPDSDAEWKLETMAFSAANSCDVPYWAKTVIQQLWAYICSRSTTAPYTRAEALKIADDEAIKHFSRAASAHKDGDFDTQSDELKLRDVATTIYRNILALIDQPSPAIAQAVAAETERCAKIADSLTPEKEPNGINSFLSDHRWMAIKISDAIRGKK